jgi:hypothetical protein
VRKKDVRGCYEMGKSRTELEREWLIERKKDKRG